MFKRRRTDSQELNTSQAGLPPMPSGIRLARTGRNLDWHRLGFIWLGIFLFGAVYFYPTWSDAVDPQGTLIPITQEGRVAIALSLLALTWWVFEVIPAGVTGAAVGIIQALFMIRNSNEYRL